MSEVFYDLCVGKTFLWLQIQKHKGKTWISITTCVCIQTLVCFYIDVYIYLYIHTFSLSFSAENTIKRQWQTGRMFATYVMDNVLISQVYKSLKWTNSFIERWARDNEQRVHKNKYRLTLYEKVPTLTEKEMQIKTTRDIISFPSDGQKPSILTNLLVTVCGSQS